MNNKIATSALIFSSLIFLSACDDNDDKNEHKIPVSEVPANISNVIQGALPGITLHKAKIEMENGLSVYELEGKLVNGNEYEMEIYESGTIIKIELDD
jgi:uncharacterized membrane protein YkoI